MKKRQVLCIFLLCSLLFHYSWCAYAHNDHEHDKEMEAVLWGNKSRYILNDSVLRDKARCLKDATSIALDQFNRTKAIQLKHLEMQGIDGIPTNVIDTIEEGGIDFSANGLTHRKYTHLGWTYVYSDQYAIANWQKRKQIMMNTVKSILNTDEEKLCDSFAAVLYYIHILGDLQTDSVQIKRDQVIPLIDKHGVSDLLRYHPNKDIILELNHYLPILFENRVSKTYQSYYSRLMRQIKKLHMKAKSIIKENEKRSSIVDNNYLSPKQVDELSKELLEILGQNLPVLLEHSIFEGVFYS